MNKQFLCLASSRKTSGYCVAGKLVQGADYGDWIRPVSNRYSGELTHSDLDYESGNAAAPLDIIELELKGKRAHESQRENYLIDDEYYWVKTGKFNGSLLPLIDRPESLWANGNSSYNGHNDRVHLSTISSPQQSLYLIKPKKLTFVVRMEGQEFGDGKKKVRARFRYEGVEYLLAVTDPAIEKKLLCEEIGEYTSDECQLLTISLGDSYQEHYYKLVANVAPEAA